MHPELLDRDDVVLLPHIGSATEYTRKRKAETAVKNAVVVLRGQTSPNAVNHVAPVETEGGFIHHP